MVVVGRDMIFNMEIKDIIIKILPTLNNFISQNKKRHDAVLEFIAKFDTDNIDGIEDKDFEKFIAGNDIGIASVRQTISGLGERKKDGKSERWNNGTYSKDFKDNWSDIYKKIGSISSNSIDSIINLGEKNEEAERKEAEIYIKTYEGICKQTPTGKGNNIINRVIASLHMERMTTICNYDDARTVLKYVGEDLPRGYQSKPSNWLYANIKLYALIKQAIEKINKDNAESSIFVNDENKYMPWIGWQLVLFVKREKMKEELKKMLEASRNLILTGAPGTGKTYLAHEIAAMIFGEDSWENVEKKTDLKERCEMVQFHPSYDYSDFVEGLRPVKSEDGKSIGFERKDGVFKAFCKNALKAYNNCTEDKNNAPKFVFIIDEINRGEMSKIFGELFFSIDPGYRGTKGNIKTQYQNLVDKEYDENGNVVGEDVFKNGFYVPENVYIIGTMNDIDRSVESMDFAMRRRFAFKEVRATDREVMLDETLSPDQATKAKQRMYNLNYRIQEIEGFNEAYHVGPAYFSKIQEDGNFDNLWENRIQGLLYEYLRGMPNAKELMESLKRAYNSEDEYVENKNGELKLVNASSWQNNIVNKPKKSKNANIGDGEDDSSEG